MKTYIVLQTFETLGDSVAHKYTNKRDAERAANRLRREIAEMVSEWEIPEDYNPERSAFIEENEAWEAAEKTAGVKYDERGERTPGSPQTYGLKAGQQIADAAVRTLWTILTLYE